MTTKAERDAAWETIREAARLLGRACENDTPGSERAYFALLDIIRARDPNLIIDPTPNAPDLLGSH